MFVFPGGWKEMFTVCAMIFQNFYWSAMSKNSSAKQMK